MIPAIGASEFLMFSQAEGNADVWWHCAKKRLNPFANHACGQVDANGNEIETDDPGPWINFLHNYYGPLIPQDIDSDGRKENFFEQFAASFQQIGEAVYDFFDDSDGTGVVENTKKIVEDGVETIVHVFEKGWEKVEKAAEKVVEFGQKVVKKVGGWFHKAWDKLTGKHLHHDNDD